MNKRPRRLLGALSLTSILVSLALAGPATAATPNLGFGPGGTPGVSVGSAAVLDTVGAGKVAGFTIWASNNGTSNISQFFLDAATDATAYGGVWKKSDGTSGTCGTTGGVLKCSFGALNAGANVVVTAAFTTPTPATADTNHCLPSPPPANAGGNPPSGDAYVCVDFQWSTTGYVLGKNNSHGDRFDWFDFVGNNGSADFSGQFPFCGDPANPTAACLSLLTINTNKSLSNGNQSWTQITAPRGALNGQLKVQDNVGPPSDCSSLTVCPTLTFVGQLSEIDVNNTQQFSSDFIQTTLALYHVNASQITGVYHYYVTSDNVVHEDTITTVCANGPDGNTPVQGCFNATKSGPNAIVNVWTHYNGKIGSF